MTTTTQAHKYTYSRSLNEESTERKVKEFMDHLSESEASETYNIEYNEYFNEVFFPDNSKIRIDLFENTIKIFGG